MGDTWKTYAFDRRTEMNVHIRDEEHMRLLQKASERLTEMVEDAHEGKVVEHAVLTFAHSEAMAVVIRDALVKKNPSLAPFVAIGSGACLYFRAVESQY